MQVNNATEHEWVSCCNSGTYAFYAAYPLSSIMIIILHLFCVPLLYKWMNITALPLNGFENNYYCIYVQLYTSIL